MRRFYLITAEPFMRCFEKKKIVNILNEVCIVNARCKAKKIVNILNEVSIVICKVIQNQGETKFKKL